MSKPKTEAQRERQRVRRLQAQRRLRERIRQGVEARYLCRVCETIPVYRVGGRCRQCYQKSEDGKTRVRTSSVFPRRAVDICYVCNVAPVTCKGRRCKPCYLAQDAKLVPTHEPTVKSARTTIEILAHDAEVVRARSAVRREAEPDRYMMIAPGEYWLKGPRCRRCRKLIMYAGTCYKCGTGRDRTVLRSEERVLA